ncbi:MAG: T9SS type A sorting domain-containing protein [Salibacteraceae bacterium]
MKKIYALLLTILPLFSFSQLSFEWHTDQFQTGYQGDDIGFDYTLTNEDTANAVNITWELLHDRSTSTDIWTDYYCEGLFVCWPDSVRTNTFELEAGQSIEIYHHVQTWADGDSGTWVSTARVYVEGDSANTVNEFVATLKTGLKVQLNGQTVYIMDGDSFEIYGGEMVPLSINDPSGFNKSALDQNMPNPFNRSTTIAYHLQSGSGSIKFHDLTGKLVMEMPLNKTEGNITLNGNLDAGIYFYTLWENGRMIDSKRMQVIK